MSLAALEHDLELIQTQFTAEWEKDNKRKRAQNDTLKVRPKRGEQKKEQVYFHINAL